MYKIAVCDDEVNDCAKITCIVKKRADVLDIQSVSCFTYTTADGLLKELSIGFDVIFLDIDMRPMDGCRTAIEIRKLDPSVIIVFCAGILRPTPDLFKVQPYRYLMKDFSSTVFHAEFDDVLRKMVENRKGSYMCSNAGKVWNIAYEDIAYVSIIKRGSQIHIISESAVKYGLNQIRSDESIKEIFTKLGDRRFVFAHNSYFVNLQHVIRCNITELQLRGNINLTIARSKSHVFKNKLLEYSVNKYERYRCL